MANRKCKTCNGKGFLFQKDNNIFTGKQVKFYGYEFPETVSGSVQTTCGKCFGKGVR